MFYFLIAPILTYNIILIAAAIIPAIALMIKVYRSDHLEPESPFLLWNLIKAGIFSALIALVGEKVFSFLLDSVVEQTSPVYNILLYFGVVACVEEGAKYFLLSRRTWNNPEFNCQYDAVVYAVFVSLGFALWENISYVLYFGFTTAIVRAITAIPGHACFGVFMGVFYGIAKRYDLRGNRSATSAFRLLAFVLPTILHGTYDYIASMNPQENEWLFIAYVAVLFVVSFLLVSKMSKEDRYIG